MVGIGLLIVGMIVGFLFGALVAPFTIKEAERRWMQKALQNAEQVQKALLRCEEWERWYKRTERWIADIRLAAPPRSIYDLLAEIDEED